MVNDSVLEMTQKILDYIEEIRKRPYWNKYDGEDIVLDEIGDEIYRLRRDYLANKGYLEEAEEQKYTTEYKGKLTTLEKAKKIIKENIEDARCGIFDTRNFVGDYMETIYEDDDLQIDICRGYAYFEVFGLSDDEFSQLEEYYYRYKSVF